MKKSFTLIELLIVLVIIGILTTLAIPSLKKYKDKAKTAEAINMISVFADSVWRYYVEAGHFPATGSGAPPPDLDAKIPLSTKYYFYMYYNVANIPPNIGDYVFVYATSWDYAQQPAGTQVGFVISYKYGASPGPDTQQMSGNWWKVYGKVVATGGSSTIILYGGWK